MGDSDEARVHVGNLPYQVTEEELRDEFEKHAAVVHGMFKLICPETVMCPVFYLVVDLK